MSDPEYRRIFYPDAPIFREGEAGDCAYIIERGKVEISTLINGSKTVVATLYDGALFGEMALVDNQVRSATATAMEETVLVVVNNDYVSSKMNTADPLMNLFLRVILERFRETRETLQGPSTDRPKEKSSSMLNHDYDRDRDHVVERIKLRQDLMRAIEQDEFELHYQPIISLPGNTIGGFEALIRWHHPQRGMVPPNDFIGLAEETGLIVPLGLWILREACRALKRFQALCDGRCAGGSQSLFMSVNLSARQISEQELLEQFSQAITDTGVDPAHIKLEITESLLMEDPEGATVALRNLKALGVTVAIDDFGTGYSSLSYLHRFPIDSLKIDRSFVITMLENDRSMEIVRAVSGLAHNMGIDIIAEGIENPEELQCLLAFQCDYGQGYLMSRPLPESQVNLALEKGLSW